MKTVLLAACVMMIGCSGPGGAVEVTPPGKRLDELYNVGFYGNPYVRDAEQNYQLSRIADALERIAICLEE